MGQDEREREREKVGEIKKRGAQTYNRRIVAF